MKALLLEDRVSRQTMFLDRAGVVLSSYSNISNVAGGDDFIKIKHSIDSLDYSFLDAFDVLIIHSSALTDKEKNELYDHCKSSKFPLVFFSGGSTATTFSQTNGFPFLNLDSQIIYSSNLIDFLKELNNEGVNLALLAFGTKWKLNILLNLNKELNTLLHTFIWPESIPRTILNSKIALSGNELLDSILLENNVKPFWQNSLERIDQPRFLVEAFLQEVKVITENIAIYG